MPDTKVSTVHTLTHVIFTALPGGYCFTKGDPGGQRQEHWVRMEPDFKLTSESQALHPFSHTVWPLCIAQLGNLHTELRSTTYFYFATELVNEDIQQHRSSTDSCCAPTETLPTGHKLFSGASCI